MDHVQIDELRIAFEKVGHGPPLILLHGGWSDSRAWSMQVDDLSHDFTVVAWDAPGCGRSSDPPASFRLPDYADCLAQFIEELGLRRPHVLGLSFGAGLALELYGRHPDIPRSLVLASGYAGWAGSLPAEEVERRVQRVLREAELPPQQWVPDYLPGMFSGGAPREVVEEHAAMMLDARPAGTIPMLQGFAEADLRDVLPRIRVPTLLLYGDADQRSPLYVARDLHEKIPRSRLVIMSGVGHVSNSEAPDRFNAEVRSFLRHVVDEADAGVAWRDA